MLRTCQFVAAAALAVSLMSSAPAHAGPKEDCEAALKQVEQDLTNTSVDGPTKNAVENLLKSARGAQKDGKHQACVKRVNSAKSKLGS